MINIDPIIKAIEESSMIQFQKTITTAFVQRAKDISKNREDDIKLIQEIAREKYVSEILYSTDEVKIYTINNSRDEWSIKYPVRSIFLNKDGKWERIATVSPNFDVAFLNYLEHKYLGGNSRFTNFAIKMLEIKIE